MTSCRPSGPPAIGATAELSRTITPDDIDRFTQISGDPLHYDLAAAKASRFGEIVVQGGITSAILNAVVAECLPGPGTVFLNVNWDFKAPVRPGDVITGRVEVIEARTDKPVAKLRTAASTRAAAACSHWPATSADSWARVTCWTRRCTSTCSSGTGSGARYASSRSTSVAAGADSSSRRNAIDQVVATVLSYPVGSPRASRSSRRCRNDPRYPVRLSAVAWM